MSLVEPGCEDFDFLDQVRIYGGVIHFSFTHIVLYLYRNIGNYTINFRKKVVVENCPQEYGRKTWDADAVLRDDNAVGYSPC